MGSRSDVPTAWRIVKARHARAAFDGEGARRYGGPWNSPGTPVVYASESRALGLLEVLAGLSSPRAVQGYLVIPVTFNSHLALDLPPRDLPDGWRRYPPPLATQRIGDAWAAGRQSVVLRVPSALVPQESNYILNPGHPDFHRLRVGEAVPVPLVIHPRLMG